MKLEYLYIDGYKGLKRLKLQFKEQTGVVPVDFLIGCNGSGKSSVWRLWAYFYPYHAK